MGLLSEALYFEINDVRDVGSIDLSTVFVGLGFELFF